MILTLIEITLGNILMNVYEFYSQEFFRNINLSDDFKSYSYFPTHIRCSTFLVGIVLGYLTHFDKNKAVSDFENYFFKINIFCR